MVESSELRWGAKLGWFTYVLQSSTDFGFYVGMTSRLDARVKEHNAGRNRSTKWRAPFTLIYVEQFALRSEARKREKFLKSGAGREFLKTAIEAERDNERG